MFFYFIFVFVIQISPAEQVILADITRTFTAHEKFQNESEGGQDAMYKISKVGSICDKGKIFAPVSLDS